MSIKGEGVLIHRNDPGCVAGVAVAFADEPSAREALGLLGSTWTLDPKRPYQVVWHGDRLALEVLIAKFKTWGLRIKPCGEPTCAGQCADAEIDHRRHSEKVGARFHIVLEGASTLAPLGRTVRVNYLNS